MKAILTILVSAVITLGLRAFPFLVFRGDRQMPQMLKDLVGGFRFENAGNTAVPAAPAAPAAPVQPDGGADSQPAAHPAADCTPAASGSKY